ncbi:P450 monooxygenase [Fusarium subglutinans]|uniref:P450 monooxygenase n=1 Tax=Gibberella subglutinans TaxID=42677 RepID=A0A8H5Q0I7_GIBSU|nr:P450 monooxygenase [Fusarium subglutinans]KAF5605999.1 P450 monooxygenase [Fusarium subglutinans]
MNRTLKILVPHIEKRLITVENGLLKDLSQDDVLTWHTHEALRKKEPRFEMADVIACRVFATVFAALESTTLTMAYALFKVCASNPSTEVWQALEDQAVGVFSTKADQTSLNGPNQSTVSGGYAGRWSDNQDRMIQLPRGARLSIAAWGIHHDEDIYADAYAFDPFRFVVSQKGDGQNTDSIATPSDNYLTFGFGKHSCPAK